MSVARGRIREICLCAAGLSVVALLGASAQAQTNGAACDRTCLVGVMDGYVKSMAAHAIASVPLAPSAVIYENLKPVALDASRWKDVAGIKAITNFPDAQSGQIVSRVAAADASGGVFYIGTRLKVVNRKIAEIETSFNARALTGPEASNVVTYDPVFDTIVPVDKRMTRAALEQIVRRYFEALGTKKPDPADYDIRCDRFSSGNRVTHRGGGRGGPAGRAGAPGAAVPGPTAPAAPTGEPAPGRGPVDREEAGGNGDVGCLESIQGNPPWLYTVEQRVPVVDPERGIAIGYTMLLYPNDRVMLISEVFKVLDGHFRMIDYIGIVDNGVKTTGFTK